MPGANSARLRIPNTGRCFPSSWPMLATTTGNVRPATAGPSATHYSTSDDWLLRSERDVGSPERTACSPSARASRANPPSGVDVAFLSFTLQRHNEEGLVGRNLLEPAVLLLKLFHIGGSHQTEPTEQATIGRRESRF